MKLFDLICVKITSIQPKECKIHLAVWNGSENPIDEYLSGAFEKWQSGQTKKNFERKYILSLIQLPGKDKWLFAGGFISHSCTYIQDKKYYQYKTEEILELGELAGRLVVSFKRTSRQSYLNAENWESNISVNELLPEKMVIEEFKGYNRTCLSKNNLDIIIFQNIDSWRAALSNVAGVYLITDTETGKVYVGSATGNSGIWQRWTEYSENGHGGNKELRTLLKDKGKNYSKKFQYSILEIADTHASSNDVLERESYWKDVLDSRVHGYNAN
jgi:hypothetical protein